MTTFNPDDTFNEFDARYLLREAWQSWTPTIDQNGNIAVSIDYAKYIVLARTVILTAHISITAAGTAGNDIIVGGVPSAIEFAQFDALGLFTNGSGLVHDSGTAVYHGIVCPITANTMKIRQATTGFVGSNPSFALANGDDVALTVTYER
jgi:hypothetical protein